MKANHPVHVLADLLAHQGLQKLAATDVVDGSVDLRQLVPEGRHRFSIQECRAAVDFQLSVGVGTCEQDFLHCGIAAFSLGEDPPRNQRSFESIR